jgi:uncharacterized membrane protein
MPIPAFQSPAATNGSIVLAVSFLLALPFALSTWMLLHSKGSNLPGCGGGSTCDAVTRSRWARWGPTPVSAGGAALYLLMLGISLWNFCQPNGRWSTLRWQLLLTCALIAIASAAWFLGLTTFVLRKFCIYCGTIHVAAVIASIAVLIHAPPNAAWPVPLAVAAIAISILIAGQLLWHPRSYQVQCVSSPANAENEAAAVPIAVAEAAPRILTGRVISLHGGRVRLRVDDWSILGDAAARYVIAWLFDHTCEECHRQHKQLLEVLDRFGGKLAIIAIPIPMHASCNPEVKCKDPERAQSCDYARLCWAIWSANPASYAVWDKFMAEEERSKPFGMAMKRAQSLADFKTFNIHGPDAVLDARIASGIDVYRNSRAETVPLVLLPGGILQGRASTVDELFAIICKHLNISTRQSVAGSTAHSS